MRYNDFSAGYNLGYRQCIIDSIPPCEKRVFLALEKLRDSAKARDVAAITGLTTSACSAFLARLVSRKIVKVIECKKRKKLYKIKENQNGTR